MLRERYLEIVAAVDTEFARNLKLHGSRIQCRPGCTSCCHQPFKITELDALRVAEGMRSLDEASREAIRARAGDYLRARLQSEVRPPCPALTDGVCSIYEFRPLICHKFGMPLYNPDKPERILACELNFKDGEEIDDPHLIQIQTSIDDAWRKLRFDHMKADGSAARTMTVAEAILVAPPDPPSRG